jgi:hypothetical protein
MIEAQKSSRNHPEITYKPHRKAGQNPAFLFTIRMAIDFTGNLIS